LHITRKRVII